MAALKTDSAGLKSAASDTATRLTLHVGLPKCASTFLQAHVFSRHPDIQFFGIYRPVHDSDVAGLQSMRNAPSYDYLLALKTRESLAFDQRKLDELRPRQEPGKAAVISDEDLSFPDKVDRAEKARRLHASYQHARILFVLRNPIGWVESWYLFDMRKGAGFVPFDRWMEHNWNRFERSLLRVLRYRALVEIYAGLFGRDHIDIVLFEDLQRDQTAFVDAVCRCVGVDARRLPAETFSASENVRMPKAMLKVADAAPWLYDLRGYIPAPLRMLLRRSLYRVGGKAEVAMPSRWRDEIAAFCADDLTFLAHQYRLPLRERGYPLT